MNKLAKIEKRSPLLLADVFNVLNQYPKSQEEREQYHQLIDSSCLYYSLSAKPLTSDTPCFFDERIRISYGDNEYIYPEFAAANDFKGFYSGFLLKTIFNVLKVHVEDPTVQHFIDSLNYYQYDDEHQMFLAIDRLFPAFVNVEEYGDYRIDLTGQGSHVFKKRTGYPLTIAPKSLDEQADFIVELDECIDWHALTVPFVS